MKPESGLFALVCLAFGLFAAAWIYFNIYEPAKAKPRPSPLTQVNQFSFLAASVPIASRCQKNLGTADRIAMF